MYTVINFKTKKELKEAVAAGRKVSIFQPNDMVGGRDLTNGDFTVEGPHFPKPHRWYAMVKVQNGYIVKVS